MEWRSTDHRELAIGKYNYKNSLSKFYVLATSKMQALIYSFEVLTFITLKLYKYDR